MKKRLPNSMDRLHENKIWGALLFLLVCGLFLLKPVSTQAETLDENKTYYVDLNGDGEQESIYYKCSYGSYNRVERINIKINGKLVLKKIFSDDDFYNFVPVSVVDIDKSDKYKDLVLCAWQEENIEKSLGYQYKNGELRQIFSCSNFSHAVNNFPENQKGDGLIYFEETYTDSNCQMGYVTQPYQIVSGKLKAVQKAVSTTTEWRKNKYRSTKALSVYKTMGDSKSSFSLKKNEVFYVQKIKFKTKKSANGFRDVKYMYIKTKSGKTGWVKNPGTPCIQGWDKHEGWSYSAYFFQ